MKIKGLLLGMLACAAMVACTNEDIVENNNGGQPEKANANLTLSISTSTGSGRAADAEVGDDTENGTAEEGSIQDAVVVISPAGESQATGLVRYYANVAVVNGAFEPSFQLKQTGKYNVLVILNPCADIAEKAQIEGVPASELYSYVTNYSIQVGADNDASVDVVTKKGNARNHFMMANQEEVTVEITNQDPERPTTKTVLVERVVSKITFTPNANKNKYPVNVDVTTIATEIKAGWLKTEVNGNTQYTYITVLNRAFLDERDEEIWILLENGEEKARYELAGDLGDYTGFVDVKETTASVFVNTTKTGPFHYAEGKIERTKEIWHVQLDKYAMVNLSKTVYAVRHKTVDDWKTIIPMGLLTGNDYLVDPKSTEKNDVVLTEAGLWDGDDANSYFFNTVNELQTSQDIYDSEFLKALPTEVSEIGENTKSQDVFLTYCLENVVTKTQQQKGMVTGIVFRGEMLDATGKNVGTIYKYDGLFFRSMDALKASVPNYESEKLVTYTNGHCYYYAPIEHFKGDENNMQYAIMRNNIYSLKITSFKGIGSSTIIPEDGTTIDDESAYLKLTTTIAPWVVRFNNIEF